MRESGKEEYNSLYTQHCHQKISDEVIRVIKGKQRIIG
jgi:hypothetical protein